MSARQPILLVLAAAVMALGTPPALSADTPSNPMPEETPELREAGRATYVRRCTMCHGLLGDGEGPAAPYLDPRPRDFTLGTFKFRTTQSGELPTNDDLFLTVSRGLNGTAMQPFDDDRIKNGLSEQERWEVIAYIKTFSFEFEDPELDPILTGKVVPLPENRAAYNAETVARGAEVFEAAKCWECHGKLGRGDGQKAFDREDNWGFPIRIRNVTHAWKIKAGGEVEDIYMRFSTGVNGTPMPSFERALDEQDRWALANFIKSLQHEMTENQVLAAEHVDGAVPDAADSPLWDAAAPMDIRMAGQVVAAPRWQNPSIELVTLKAVYSDEEIAFLIEWDDPFVDVTHDESQELDLTDLRAVGGFTSYVAANDEIPRQLETFRDSVALQFPIKLPEGTRKPHFLRGDTSNPVHLWTWKADMDAEGAPAVEEAMSRGWRQGLSVQEPESTQVMSTASWDQGRWSVVMKRPLQTEDKNDVQFVPGIFIPMSINAWDGSNGEHGLIMSLSTWYSVVLVTSTPASVYIKALLAAIVAGFIGLWAVRWASKPRDDESV